MDFPKIVKEYRVQHGLKQTALAEQLNVDVSTISRWENGSSMPTTADQARLTMQLQSPTEAARNAPVIALAIEIKSKTVVACSNAYAALHRTAPKALEGKPYEPIGPIGEHIMSKITRTGPDTTTERLSRNDVIFEVQTRRLSFNRRILLYATVRPVD